MSIACYTNSKVITLSTQNGRKQGRDQISIASSKIQPTQGSGHALKQFTLFIKYTPQIAAKKNFRRDHEIKYVTFLFVTKSGASHQPL